MDDRLFVGDCRDVLPTLPADAAQLVVTSPPYNVGWEYGDDPTGDLLTEAEYWDLLTGFLEGAHRVLRRGGVLVLNLPSDICVREGHGWDEVHRAYPIASLVRAHLYTLRATRDWLLHPTAIWAKGREEGRPEARCTVLGNAGNFRFRPCHEELIVASKGDYRIPDKRAWTAERYAEKTKTVQWWPWGRGTKASGRPPTFPRELPEWAIDLFTNPGDLVLDPFAGEGTTAEVARQRGRRVWLIEREPSYRPRLEAILGHEAPPGGGSRRVGAPRLGALLPLGQGRRGAVPLERRPGTREAL